MHWFALDLAWITRFFKVDEQKVRYFENERYVNPENLFERFLYHKITLELLFSHFRAPRLWRAYPPDLAPPGSTYLSRFGRKINS